MKQIEDNLVTSLLTSIVGAVLLSVERQLPPHARKARAINKLHEALRDFAKLNSAPLSKEMLNMGGDMFNYLLDEIEIALDKFDENGNIESYEQLLLPFPTE